MIPILIEENALSPAEAGYVGAFNLAGFLFGVLLQPTLRNQIGERAPFASAVHWPGLLAR